MTPYDANLLASALAAAAAGLESQIAGRRALAGAKQFLADLDETIEQVRRQARQGGSYDGFLSDEDLPA